MERAYDHIDLEFSQVETLCSSCFKPGHLKSFYPLPGGAVNTVYKIEAQLILDPTSKTESQRLLGMFIIGTNELDEAKLSKADMLHNYKQQQSVERGFRFLKDPLFLCSSVFLKKEERIVALSMVMCLCLLIYMLTQRLVRQKLSEQSRTLPNQVGKPTDRPTMRWIYQVSEGIHVVYHRTQKKTNYDHYKHAYFS